MKPYKDIRDDLFYRYEIKHADNWFLNFLAKHIGIKTMYYLRIIR